QAQPVVLQHFQGRARNIGLGIARPGNAHLAELSGDGLGTRQIVGEGVVVEEELLDLREVLPGERDLRRDVLRATRTVAMPADRLRPETKGAARLAAAAGID